MFENQYLKDAPTPKNEVQRRRRTLQSRLRWLRALFAPSCAASLNACKIFALWRSAKRTTGWGI